MLLDVTHRTLQNWEKGCVRIPYAAYQVLKIKVGYVMVKILLSVRPRFAAGGNSDS